MFLGHNWLVRHNPEVNQKEGKIQFIRYPRSYRTIHQDIEFKTRRTQATESQDKEQQKIGKKPDQINPEDLPECCGNHQTQSPIIT